MAMILISKVEFSNNIQWGALQFIFTRNGIFRIENSSIIRSKFGTTFSILLTNFRYDILE